MLSTISPCRTARGTKDGTQDQDRWERKKREDVEVGSGSLVEGTNLGDGYTQGYIYVHKIDEYGEREAASPRQENARSPASYARECAGTYTPSCFHIDTQSHVFVLVSTA